MKTMVVIVGILCVLNTLFGISYAVADAWSNNHKVRDKVLKNYDKNALPQRTKNDTTTVYVRLGLRSYWLDEEKQIFTANSWMVMSWNDERLKWDYKDFGGLRNAHFGDGELWKPDLAVYNNAEISEVDHYGNVHFIVYNDGTVTWVPPASFKVPCSMDLKFWPFDQHTCQILVGSWSTHGWQINFELYNNNTEIQTNLVIENSNNWDLIKANQQRISFTYSCCPEPYVTIAYTFTLKRNSPTFGAIVVVPAVTIPMFLVVQFILPVDHSKRLSIGFVCSILVLLEMLFLKFSLPKLGTSVPLIVSYYSQCFITVILTVALSTILGRLSHPQNPLLAFPPPEIVKRILTGPLATVLCVQMHASKVGLSGKTAEDGEVLDSSAGPNYSHEWLLIAKVVDRIAFLFIMALFVFSLIGYVSPIK